MLTCRWRLVAAIAAAAALSLHATACEKVPLLAPTGSTITLSTARSVLPGNGTATIVVQVLESSGTPPHSGTHITLSTTLGHLEPDEVSTDVNGRATTTFFADGVNGVAVITAVSGGASTGTEGGLALALGTAAVGRVVVSANPTSVGASGGSSTITAVVLDRNGNFISSVPVTFTTNAGSLSPLIAMTSGNGTASSVLTTNATATVTAGVGAEVTTDNGSSGQASGTVTVNVTNAPTITITPPTTAQKGVPATFTVTVTAASSNGVAVKEVVVNWGDGQSENLGGFVGTQTAAHRYNSDGPFTVSATVTDVAGGSNRVSTTVVVTEVPRPSIVVNPTPTSQTVNGSVSFAITITAPTGVSIVTASIDYGDGQVDELGGATSVTKTHTYKTTGTKTVVVSATDTTGRTSTGSTSVVVTP